MGEAQQKEESNIQTDDPVETLPFRAVQEIFETVASKDDTRKVSINQVFDEFSRAFGKEDVEKSAQLRLLNENIKFNNEMDLNYSDRMDPISVVPMPRDSNQEKDIIQKIREKSSTSKTQVVKNELNWQKVNTSKSRTSQQHQKFENSKQVYNRELEQQHRVINLFDNQKMQSVDKSKMEYRDPIRLTYRDEKPSEKEIERQRGDFDTEMTEEDRALESAQKYMKKYIEYVRFVKNIKKLEQIPTDAERALILDNFYKYLQDARFYIKFYSQYSKFWAPEATRTIEPYKGLFIPVERRKESETFDFEKNDIKSFGPLKKLIFQDFHNRVRSGLPPSLDLHAQLPELARNYARVTAVPSMKEEEMEALFYPGTRKFRPHNSYPVDTGHNRLEYLQKSSKLNLNIFQQKFTNFFLQKQLNQNFIKCYDSASDNWLSISGKQFLQYIDEFIGALFNSKSDELIFLPPCKNNSSSTLFFTLLISACVCSNIPFILSEETIIEESTIKKSFLFLRDYFICPIVATDDENLLFRMNLKQEKQFMNSTGIKKIVYFGESEPHTTIKTSQGSLSSTDPISSILQPSHSKPIEIEPKQSSVIRFVPSLDTIADHIKVDLLKNRLAKMKGSSVDSLQEKRQQIQQWNSFRQKSAPAFFSMHLKSNSICAHTVEGLHQILQEMSNEWKDIIALLHSNSKDSQVLIYFPSEHPMFLYSILFCIFNSLPFSIAYSNSTEDFLSKLVDTSCQVVFADVDLIIAAWNWIEKTCKQKNQSVSDAIMSVYLQQVKKRKVDLSHLDPLILQLKQVPQYQHQPNLLVKTFLCVGNSQSISTLNRVFPQNLVFYCNISSTLYSPIRIIKVNSQQEKSQDTFPTAIQSLLSVPLRETYQRKLLYVGKAINLCIPISNANQQILKRNQELSKEVLNLNAPQVVIASFEKKQLLDLEHQFYSQLELMLHNSDYRQGKNNEENALIEALLEEIQSILSIKSANQLLWEDVLQFVRLRRELVKECLQIQVFDYEKKIAEAKLKSQISFNNQIQPLYFLFKEDQEGIELDDIQLTTFRSDEYIYSTVKNVYQGKTTTSKFDLHALGSLFTVLSQGNIDFMFLIPKASTTTKIALQAYVICYKKLNSSQWHALCKQLKKELSLKEDQNIQIGLSTEEELLLPNFEQVHQMQIVNDCNASPMRYYPRQWTSYSQVFGLSSKL